MLYGPMTPEQHKQMNLNLCVPVQRHPTGRSCTCDTPWWQWQVDDNGWPAMVCVKCKKQRH